MALTYLKSTIGGYMFDVNFKENYKFENQITQNPVQSGASVSDHVFNQPVTMSFEVGVSDCLASVVSGQFSTLASRSASAFQILYDLWNKKTVLEVDNYMNGSVFKFSNMLIKSITVTRDKSTHHAIKATIDLQQIIVTNAVSVSVSASTSNTQATNQTNYGNKYFYPFVNTAIEDKISKIWGF
jgi:hypothetical protein